MNCFLALQQQRQHSQLRLLYYSLSVRDFSRQTKLQLKSLNKKIWHIITKKGCDYYVYGSIFSVKRPLFRAKS